MSSRTSSLPIKALPSEERPRERLVRYGTKSLSSIELIAILLGSGTKNRSVLQLAGELLAHFQTVKGLSEASLEELKEIKGIGIARAIQLHAAFALAHRIEESCYETLNTPEKIYAFIKADLEREKNEVFLLLLRDVKLRCIHREILFQGTLTELLFHPREVLHLAVKHKAHSIVIAHNHPTGDPTPSTRDLEMTKRLYQAATLVGIPLADHLIIGRGRFVSLARNFPLLFR